MGAVLGQCVPALRPRLHPRLLSAVLCLVVSGLASAQLSDQAQFAEGTAPCDLPSHWCVEGQLIQSGDYCTAYCPAGFAPDVDRLRCENAVLVPNLYKCEKGKQKNSVVSLISALLAIGVCGLFIIGMICSDSTTGSKERESAVYENREEVEELEPLAGPMRGSPTSQPLLATDLDQE
ncbi:unnamed protein product [Symbiodinium natans]|uniref:Sushi domain-containing protein n=1 Tax=Symbiodinium natans TaxID=878477 RepID=A0A812J745_9DINO|nr:unnamed protein product [Symbiodinium natans]